MKNANNSMHKMRIKAVVTMIIAYAALGIGCTPAPTEVTDPEQPIDCNDLRVHSATLSMIGGGPVAPGDTMPADEGFNIRWFAEYRKGVNMNYFGETGDYVARVTIERNGEEFDVIDIDATPINVASGEYDQVAIEEGLPPGDYIIRVELDVNGDVDECTDLLFVFNNISERTVTVEGDEMDEVTSGGGPSPSNDPAGGNSAAGELPGDE